MPNLRIVSDNALERVATLTASSTAGGLAVANLVNWKKSSFHRAASAGVAYTATWAAPEPIGCVALPFCNLSPTALWRIRVSSETAAQNLLRYSEQFDTAAWAKSATGITITANYGAAPDGTMTADRIQFTAAGQYVSQSTSLGVGIVCSGAAWVKGISGQTIAIVAGGVNKLFALNGGWQRLKHEGAVSSSDLFAISAAGATARDVTVWGAQMEAGYLSTSYWRTTASASIRPAGHIDAWQSYDYDSGLVQACPWPAAKLRGFTAAQAASAYAYGGGTYARHWLPAEVQARGIAVDIVDPENVQGYLEAACMVAGPYWSPKYNAAAASVTVLDGSENVQTGGGDTCGEVGFISDEVNIDLSYFEAEDRAALMGMARNSAVYPLLLSVFPNDPDPARERDYMIYATRSKSSAIGMKYAAGYTTSITFKEV